MTLSKIHRVGKSVYVKVFGNGEAKASHRDSCKTHVLKIHNFDENDTIPILSSIIILEPSVHTSTAINGYQIEMNNPYEFIYYVDKYVL